MINEKLYEKKKWGLGCVSRTIQYGLEYVLGLCKCLRVICICKKRVCNNHPLFFSVKFPLFYCHFSFVKAPISIFGRAHWTLKTVANVVANSDHHSWAHQCTLQPCLSDCNRCKTNDKFFAGTRTPDTPTDQKKIFLPPLFYKMDSTAMPAQKYISKMWQWHLRVHPPKYILTAFHSQNIFCSCETDIIIFVWHFKVHVSKIFFRFCGFLWANTYRKYI